MERQIIIGLISNNEYLANIRQYWNEEFIESSALRLIAKWCVDYFDKHGETPGSNIERLFDKKRKRIDKDLAEEIEEDILPSLSAEYNESEEKSIKFLLAETEEHFVTRSMKLKSEAIESLLQKGELNEAKALEETYELFKGFKHEDLDTKPESINFDDKIDEVFSDALEPLFKYPGALGRMLNEHLVRGGFIGILAPEKRYKSWILLDMAMRAYEQGVPVAFFQAGDMTENQQLLRMFSYLTKRPTREIPYDRIYVPVVDCIKNQRDNCQDPLRECFTGVTTKSEKELREEKIPIQELKELYENNPDYKRCINCAAFSKNKWGTIWLEKIKPARPLSKIKTKQVIKKFFSNDNLFRMRTYANGTLTVKEMKSVLKQWKVGGFFPKFIAIDYADLIVDYSSKEHRHQQNKIWKDLRAVSQEEDALIAAPTQADANSYEVGVLKLKNFSEDKRKYAHVTAMFGLNHDKDGVEKGLGVLRINKLIVREGVNENEQVHVLQRLDIGRPIVDSYF